MWSSFALRVGNPAQSLRVLPSTAGQAIWAVATDGCASGPAVIGDCARARAGTLNFNNSLTWEPKGIHSLALEANFGFAGISAMYGLDTVALGFSNHTGGPLLNKQIVAGLETNLYYIGTFGLGQQPTNITGYDDGYPSFLTSLASHNVIPSRSWGYTAGASYRK